MKMVMMIVFSLFTLSTMASTQRFEAYKCKVLKGSIIEKGSKFKMYQNVDPRFYGKNLANDMYFTLPGNSILGEIRMGGYFFYGTTNIIPASFTNGLNVSIQVKPNKSIGRIKRRFKAEMIFTNGETAENGIVNIKCRRI